jgi:zinc-binding alcohol dehydrogenase family protein
VQANVGYMTETMRAVGYRKALPIADPESLVDATVAVPTPGPHDLFVRVHAVSVNPVDVKVRATSDPGGELKILGYDASGVVAAVGADVTLFAPGDEVYYAGSIARPGTNSEYHLVNENIVGHKPKSLSFAEAAAIPLAGIAACEALLDRFCADFDTTGTLLVIGAAGGVGSMMIQLARALTSLTVIGTASRPESQQWARQLGAHAVIDHHDLAGGVAAAAPDGINYLLSPFSAGNIDTYATIMSPGGHIVALDEPEGLDILPLKPKSISWHWELMFTRPIFLPNDPTQHRLLQRVSKLVDEGSVRTTMTSRLGPINAENMRRAHAAVEKGASIGKMVVSGW